MGQGNNEKQKWRNSALQLPGTEGQEAWLDKKGQLVSDRSYAQKFGWEGIASGRRFVDEDSVNKLNKYLDRTGNTLQSNGRAPVVGYREIGLQKSFDSPVSNDYVNGDYTPATSTYIPIYGQSSGRGNGQGGNGRRGRGERNQGEAGHSAAPASSVATGSTPASTASNQISRSGAFDVPGRPSGAFAADFFSAGSSTPAAGPTGNDGINSNAAIFSANRIGGLADGYPRNVPQVPQSNWADALSAAQSSNQGAFASDTDDDENQRFAASARFRDSLYQTALS